MTDKNKAPKKHNFREKDKSDNHSRIKDFVMRGGGEPFGKPFEVGPQTLTERVVTFFKQRSFFGFESLENPNQKNRVNKFTRYGAARYRGKLKISKKED